MPSNPIIAYDVNDNPIRLDSFSSDLPDFIQSMSINNQTVQTITLLAVTESFIYAEGKETSVIDGEVITKTTPITRCKLP